MKKISYLFFASFLTCMLYSCMAGQPISKEKPYNNETYNVEYLFEHDGCKVYRFRDMGNYVYFTNCNGNVTAIQDDSTSNRVETITRIEY